MKVLVAAPHPDDEIIGCGGSLIKLAGRGYQITVVYLTSGEAGSLSQSGESLARLREEEAREGARLLGAQELIFLRNADGYLEYSQQNLIALVKLIRGKRPDLVYLPHGEEIHPDHQVTCRLMLEALRRAEGPWFAQCGLDPWRVGKVLGYEVFTPLTSVSYVEDITEVMALKLEALGRHVSQLNSLAYDEGVKGLNRFRGVTTGRGDYCECFQVISLDDLSF